MKAISLKIKDDIFKDLEEVVKEAHLSRNAYINKALEFYNKINRKRKWRQQLRNASRLVGADSLALLREIEGIDPHLLE